MATYNPQSSLGGFAEGPAESYQRIEPRPKTPYKKGKGFPPARKKPDLNRPSAKLLRPTSLPGTPPEYPAPLL